MKSAPPRVWQLEDVLGDYLERLEQHERPNEAEYLKRFPEHREPLEDFFRNLRMLQAATPVGAMPIAPPVVADRSLRDVLESEVPRIGPFFLIKRIAEGSQGVVYLAERAITKQRVALKVIRDGALASDADRRLFEAEVELASLLKHPHIANVYERGADTGCEYFALEYIEGQPPGAFVSERGLNTVEIVRLFLQVCSAVGHAHQRGVLHRDLKPMNILVDATGHAYLLDFGLAKLAAGIDGGANHSSRVGEFDGTWCYASPEQAKRDPSQVGMVSDVYALGVVLYELLTKELPYPVIGQDHDAIARHILHTVPAPPSRLARGISRDLDAILLTCLEKSPAARYQSATELEADLQRYLVGDAVVARRTSPMYVAWKSITRNRRRLVAVVLCVAGAFALLGAVGAALVREATVELRGVLVRDADRRQFEDLGSVVRMLNFAAAVRQAHPMLDEVRRLERMPMVDPSRRLSEITRNLPTFPAEPDFERTPASWLSNVGAWIRDNEANLAGLASDIERFRVTFAGQLAQADGWLIGERPGQDTADAARAAQAYAVRALLAHESGDHDTALGSLKAGLALAGDIADTRLLQQRDPAITALLYDFEAALRIVSRELHSPEMEEAYADWVLSTVVTFELGPSLFIERQATVEQLGQCTVGDASGGPGRIDWDRLDRSTGGLLRASLPPSASERTFPRTSPLEAIRLVERYFGELAGWDGITLDELMSRSVNLERELARHAAWTHLGCLVPRCRTAFERLIRLRSTHAAARLAACVGRYRAVNGVWPSSLDEAVRAAEGVSTLNPVTGSPFLYAVVGDRPYLSASVDPCEILVDDSYGAQPDSFYLRPTPQSP